MASEASIVLAIKRWLKQNGWVNWKNHGTGYSTAGLPDLMALKNGRFVAIEVKRPGKQPSEIQRQWLKRLSSAGVTAFVACSVDDVASVLGGPSDGRNSSDGKGTGDDSNSSLWG